MQTAKDIMTSDVITVSPTLTVDKLAATLWANKISGAPVVDDEGEIVGIATENDLIDQTKKVHLPTVVTILDSFFFLENPAKLDKEIKKMAGTTVQDICTTDIVTIVEETPLDEIASIMADKKVHTLPVIKAGKIVGIVGKSDIIKTFSKAK